MPEVSWSAGFWPFQTKIAASARQVDAERKADTPENRQALMAKAETSRQPAVLCQSGRDLVLLSSPELRVASPAAPSYDPRIGMGDKISIAGQTAKVLCTSDGLQGIGGADVVVAVVDTGVDVHHPDLQGVLLPGFNVFDGSQDVKDSDGHGTAMASVVAGVENAPKGVPGIKILPIKVLDGPEGDTGAIAKGIYHAVNAGARIINLSAESADSSEDMAAAIAYAEAHDVLVVAATGNSGKGAVSYPAAYEGVLAVGAATRQGKPLPTSNYGSGLDVLALGLDVRCAKPGGGHTRGSGTSAATAQCSQAAAVIARSHPGWSARQIAEELVRGADPQGGKATGRGEVGVLDLSGALFHGQPKRTIEPGLFHLDTPARAGSDIGKGAGILTSLFFGPRMILQSLSRRAAMPLSGLWRTFWFVGTGFSAWGAEKATLALWKDAHSPFDARKALVKDALSLGSNLLLLGGGLAMLTGVGAPVALAASGVGVLLGAAGQILDLRDSAQL